MKSILFIAALLVSANSESYGFVGFLSGQHISGMYKVCKYSNGKVITVRSASLCPLKVGG